MQYAPGYETKLLRSLMTPSGHHLLKIIPTAWLYSSSNGSRSADQCFDDRLNKKRKFASICGCPQKLFGNCLFNFNDNWRIFIKKN